ncbi:MAG: hypothetical protein FJZ00_01425, partial [Candidatus Sericytochromatia bacterium]|nr:hypothetical protein [Candidatus Tanganyikabacteria bacterium]
SGVIWTSSDPTLVSVDASGNVAATRLASQSVVVIWESRQNAGDGPFDLTRAVGAGDTVDFCLTGGFAGGNTPLRVTITPGQ